MNRTDYLIELVMELELFPAAAICFFPMHQSMRLSRRKTGLFVMLVLCGMIPFASWLDVYHTLSYNALALPILAVSFLLSHYSLKVHISQSLSVFFFTCVLFGFINNFANGIDAIMHPESDLEHFSMEAAVIQLLLSFLSAGMLYQPLRKYGGYLITRFRNHMVLFFTVFIFSLLLACNILFVLHYYETLWMHNVMYIYWTVLVLIFILFLSFCVCFYFIVRGMLKDAETMERNQILEAEKVQYRLQQKYLDDTARTRHDFRQTVRTLQVMAREGNMEELSAYLDSYAGTMPENNIQAFCSNEALNAILNYYSLAASDSGIRMDIRVSLPQNCPVRDVDLCSITGNILENAFNACLQIPSEDRYICLTMKVMYETELYISAVNSCPEDHKGSRTSGHGIGLSSTQSIAQSYGGQAQFRQKKNQFYTDVVLDVSEGNINTRN